MKATSVLGGARHGLCGKRTRNGPDCGGHTCCTRVGHGSRGSPCGWWTWRSPGRSPYSGHRGTLPRAMLRPPHRLAPPVKPPAGIRGWAGCVGGECRSGGSALPAGAPGCTWRAETSENLQRGTSPCWGGAGWREGVPGAACPSCGRWWGPWGWCHCGLTGWGRACGREMDRCPALWERADGGRRALGSPAEGPWCQSAGPAPC